MKREYGIDLLKIVAMLLIIAHHIVFWGGYGLWAEKAGLKGVTLAVLNAYCLLAVNCFVMASGWVMCHKEFKINRIVRLWCEVEFYSLLVLLVAAIFFPSIHINTRAWIFTLLPLTMNRYWFFTNYVGLFFLMPVLNAAINHLERKTLVIILMAGFVLFSFHPFFLKNDMMHVYRGYCVFWFCYIYLLAGTISVHHIMERIPTLVAIAGIIIGGVSSYLAFVGANWISPKLGMAVNPTLFDAYNSPFILLGSLSMLLVFSRIHIGDGMLKKFITFVIPGVFSVYIIHSHSFFRIMTHWNENWTKFLDAHDTCMCLIAIILASLIIFGGCILIDAIRRKVTKFIMNYI